MGSLLNRRVLKPLPKLLSTFCKIKTNSTLKVLPKQLSNTAIQLWEKCSSMNIWHYWLLAPPPDSERRLPDSDFFRSSISAISDCMVSRQLKISFLLPPSVSSLVYLVVY